MTAFRTFQLDWRKKAAAFQILDRMPLGHHAYYFIQRRVTKTYPRTASQIEQGTPGFIEHVRFAERHLDMPLAAVRHFEFGAGWDLFGNIVNWCFGLEQQHCYDLTRWVKPELINIVIQHFQLDPPAGAVRVPREFIRTDSQFGEDLKNKYGIDYVAPADASRSGRPDGSVDFVCTTSVLEHIPEQALPAILRETHRIMHSGAIASHAIDYTDHYAHSDGAINEYNFLQFEEAQWERFSPGIHYQNRLRHQDYEQLFRDAGFEIVSVRTHVPDDACELIGSVNLAGRYRERPVDELATTFAHFVLRKA